MNNTKRHITVSSAVELGLFELICYQLMTPTVKHLIHCISDK